MRCAGASAPPLLLVASALMILAPSLVSAERRREPSYSPSDQLTELLGQVGDDGQPEDIGYGFQRARGGTPTAPVLTRDTLDRILDEYIKAAAAEEREAAKERPVTSVFRERQNGHRMNYERPRVTAALVDSPRAPTDPDDPTDKPSPGEIDGRVAAALQDLWASMSDERLPQVVDELSDQDAALLLEELGRESGGISKRDSGAWAAYPEDYQALKYPPVQALRSDHRIGRRWLAQRQDAIAGSGQQHAQHYRRSASGPAEYGRVTDYKADPGRQRLSKRSPLRLGTEAEWIQNRSPLRAATGAQRLSKRSPFRLATDDKVRDDLMHIFASPDSQPGHGTDKSETPKSTGVTSTSAPLTSTTPVASTSTTAQQQTGAHAPMAPSVDNNGTSHNDHGHEHTQHAPPLLSAEGKQPYTRESSKRKPTSQNLGTEEEDAAMVEEPRALELRLHKKSIRWSDYFGIDRRRRRTPTESASSGDSDDDGGLLQRYLQVLFSQADQDGDMGQPRSLEKRVAVKKDAADVLAEEAARCPAVAPLVDDCSRIVAEFDELLPLCALHRACHLCGSIIAAWPASCDSALRMRTAEVCGANTACMFQAARLASRISAPGGDACSRHSCLADFLASDAGTDDDSDAAATLFGRLGSLNNNSR